MPTPIFLTGLIFNFPKRFIYFQPIRIFGKIMPHAKISQKEFLGIRKLYEKLMSNACHGLFFMEGSIIGAEIADLATKDRKNYFKIAKKELKERGWLEDVTFKDDTITVKGSIEASENDIPTCHRLRGIFRHLYEVYRAERAYCEEEKCESLGDKACVFKIEPVK